MTAKKPIKTIRIPTKISKNLSWIEKYLRKARQHMPSLVLPRHIRAYKPPINKESRTLGSCYIQERLITLATHRVVIIQGPKRKRRKHVALSQKEILMTLAHEMAHLRHDLHNFEQEYYAATIFRTFGLQDRCPYCKGTGNIPMQYVN